VKTSRSLILLAFLALVGCGPAAQPGGKESRVLKGPDRRGEVVTDGPAYERTKANTPIPAEMHQRNTGGSDGAGLCVIASAVIDGRYVGQKDAVERLWEAAKKRPGGYHPIKFDELARDVAPDLKYAHHLGGDYEVLKRWSETGHPVCVTWSTSSLYGGQQVAHMVTGSHFGDNSAAIIDNNDPGKWYWVPKAEFERRWRGMGGPWAMALSKIGGAAGSAIGPLALIVGGAMLIGWLVGGSGSPKYVVPVRPA
jgi:hypothetical protein